MKTKRQKLIIKLDEVFGNYIRYRDKGYCITCGFTFNPAKRAEYHAGHLISRGKHSVRWDERNVYGQCKTCNGIQNWESDNAYMLAKLIKRRLLTSEEYEQLRIKSRKEHKVPICWFEEKIKEYEDKLKKITTY